MSYNSLEVANVFIDLSNKEHTIIPSLNLHKMVFLAHGWWSGITNTPLIHDTIVLSEYGPKIPLLYNYMIKFGTEGTNCRFDIKSFIPIKSDEYDFLIAVYDKYKSFSLEGLIELIRKTPWGVNSEIKFDDIREYYANRCKEN